MKSYIKYYNIYLDFIVEHETEVKAKRGADPKLDDLEAIAVASTLQTIKLEFPNREVTNLDGDVL